MKKSIIVSTIFALLISFVPIVFSQSAHAAEKCDTIFYSSNDILYYNPCEKCTTSGSTILGGSNEEKTFKWFRAKGLNAAAAAGILGNIDHESSFNPFRMQTTYSERGIDAVHPIESVSGYNLAFGLVQWDGGRRQEVLKQMSNKFPDYKELINSYGKSADGYKQAPPEKNDAVLDFSLTYVDLELSKGYTRVYDEIKGVPDTEEGVVTATETWNRKYEVSADYTQQRHEKAKGYYRQFKDAVIPNVDTSSGGNGCGAPTPAGEVVHYLQTDPKWTNVGYAGSNIGEVGCGPTSMAIILASLVDKNITPPDVAAVAGQQSGGTSSHGDLIKGVNQKWGLSISTTPLTMQEAIEFVKAGKGYVWMGGTAPEKQKGPFTTGGHMVAMVGVNSDGSVIIADPYGDGVGHQKIANYPAEQIAAESGGRYGVPKK